MDDLRRWCAAQLGGASPKWQEVGGDASSRRYFRLLTPPASGLLAVYAPPEHEDSAAFVAVQQRLAAGGITVPALHAIDIKQGYLLLEDFGDTLLLARLEGGDTAVVEALYQQALQTLLQIQQCPREAAGYRLPHYSRQLLEEELGLFGRWFVSELLELELRARDERLLRGVFELLIENMLAQPTVCVHRDYHARNLMPTEDGRLGVIDFQDAVWGPVAYDVASLLKDCYIAWERVLVERWVEDYRSQAVAAGILSDEDDSERFLRDFDLSGLQRHLKVLGIFARLWLRDGKARYLGDLPRVLRYVHNCCEHYPELEPFHNWFAERLGTQLVPRLQALGVATVDGAGCGYGPTRAATTTTGEVASPPPTSANSRTRGST